MCWGIDSAGFKHLLHLAVGNTESETAWTSSSATWSNRGLRVPTSVTADGAPGLLNALETVWPKSLRIRCWFHWLGNIRAKLPEHAAAVVMAHVRAIRDAATLDAARATADRVINTFSREFPAAMACLADDLDALLAITPRAAPASHHRAHHQPCRTLLRRGTPAHQSHPRLNDERSAMKLVFATLIRCAARWSRVAISDLERHQLQLLRVELGIDPPPQQHTKSTKKKTAA